jgi:hypothetical protein
MRLFIIPEYFNWMLKVILPDGISEDDVGAAAIAWLHMITEALKKKLGKNLDDLMNGRIK